MLDAETVPDRAVLHCFTGGPDELDRCLRAGLYVSFSGIVTFKNADDVRAAVARCPLDRMLIETDAPFLAPVPHRGRRQPARLSPLGGRGHRVGHRPPSGGDQRSLGGHRSHCVFDQGLKVTLL